MLRRRSTLRQGNLTLKVRAQFGLPLLVTKELGHRKLRSGIGRFTRITVHYSSYCLQSVLKYSFHVLYFEKKVETRYRYVSKFLQYIARFIWDP